KLSIKMLQYICQDPQTVVDLFLNYDSTFEMPNVYEDLVATLSKVVQESPVGHNWVTPEQVMRLKASSLKTLATILQSLVQWLNRRGKAELDYVDIFERQRQHKRVIMEGAAIFNKDPK